MDIGQWVTYHLSSIPILMLPQGTVKQIYFFPNEASLEELRGQQTIWELNDLYKFLSQAFEKQLNIYIYVYKRNSSKNISQMIKKMNIVTTLIVLWERTSRS